MPPTAPIIGNIACFGLDNSPCKNSLLISKETKKKKTAMSTSLIQCKTLNFKPKLSVPRVMYFFSIEKYSSLYEPLLIIKAKIAASKSIIPDEASSLKKSLNGLVICWIICTIYLYSADLSIAKNVYLTYKTDDRGVAQPGSASGLGPEGRRFKSCRPDH